MHINFFKETFQALDMCQLGDEVRRKEEKLDSVGVTSQNIEH